jgi:hypothetical protein
VSDDPRSLRDEVALLERSLADARAEHDAGDLDDAGLAAIERRDGARLASARARLDDLAGSAADAGGDAVASPDEGAAPRRRPRWLLGVGVGCLAAAALVIGLAAADPFASSPAERVTRSTQVQALLLTAEKMVGTKHPLRALSAYEAVLRLAPHNPEALVEAGWLRYEFLGVGRSRAQADLGYAELQRAVRLAPRSAAAHLYLAVALFQHARKRGAAQRQLLAAAALPETVDQQRLNRWLFAALASR